MQHVTFVKNKRGRFTLDEIETLTERIIRFGPFPDNVIARKVHVSRDMTGAAFWFSNEDGGPQPVESATQVVYAVGYPVPAEEQLQGLVAGPLLHRQIGLMSGRFSAAIFDLDHGDACAAVPLARQDPVYHTDSGDLLCMGNWSASVAAATQMGALSHEEDKLFGFLNSGHFIADETFYKDVEALPGYSSITTAGGQLSISSDLYQTFVESIESVVDENVFHEITDALIAACRTATDLSGQIVLNLSGGKDSRLLLAAFVAAGFEVEGRTYSGGSSNESDVYSATLVAKAAGIKHEIVPYGTSPLADATETTVDFYQRTHGLLRASDASVVAWVNQTYNPRFNKRITLNGLGGELMRGGHASKADQVALAARQPTSTLQKRWGKFSTSFRPDLQLEFSNLIQNWMERFSPYQLTALQVADFGYLVTKLGRWGSAISRPGDISHRSFYPFLDNRLTTLIYKLPPHLRVGDRLIHHLVSTLNPDLVNVPIAYDDWKCGGAAENARIRELHPRAFIPRGQGIGRNTDWRMNWLQLLPEFKRQYLESTDQVLRSMVNDAHVLKLLDGAATPNDRYFLFSLYAASIMRSGGLERDAESHPLKVTL